MKKNEAEEAVIAEWHRWLAEYPISKRSTLEGLPSTVDALGFFACLRRERPYLLRYRSADDKWQVVKGWLLNRGLVSDQIIRM